ncbi:MAG: hypothetical protein A3K67_04165 [Euryarchaeota archaeon RBG_16_62_10]|nr:MAG: hypothetical protein A3K67_04165 [Euryarchaeota archaeon RBG_16_62_10]
MTVMGQSTEVFVITQTGSADISGGFEGITMSGDMTMTGTIHRLSSNFSIVGMSMSMAMDVTAGGISMDMTMAIEGDYSPPMDDYVGDAALSVGYTSTSGCTATETTTIDFFGMNETDTYVDDMTMTLEVVAANVSVTTEAGTFSCYKVEVTTDFGGDISTVDYYYSEKVGNFVKMEGDNDPILGLAGLELKSYSHGGSGGAGILGGAGIWIILAVVVAAVVLLGLAVLMMTRKRAQMPPPMMPPGQMGPPPPPAQ